MRNRTVALITLATSLLWAQTQLPDTPAARQLARWLEAFNQGDRESLKQFLETHFPRPAAELDDSLAFRDSHWEAYGRTH